MLIAQLAALPYNKQVTVYLRNGTQHEGVNWTSTADTASGVLTLRMLPVGMLYPHSVTIDAGEVVAYRQAHPNPRAMHDTGS